MKLSIAVRSSLISEASARDERMLTRAVQPFGGALAHARASLLATLTERDRRVAPLALLSDSVFGGHG